MNQRQPKILVVEDEAVVLHTLELILKQKGYEIRSARDGNEALATATMFQPDTLLCDINLPGINGIEVAKRVRQELPFCRVVLLSGEISSADLLDDARKSGYYFEVLAKPADPEHLLRVLASGFSTHAHDSLGIHRVK